MECTEMKMGLVTFQRYYERKEARPSGSMWYYSINDRKMDSFPRNRFSASALTVPNVEIKFNIDRIVFVHNPNRILLSCPGASITFNRVEYVALFRGQFSGDVAYIFCKGSDCVHCIQFDKY